MILDAERHGGRVDALIVGGNLHLQLSKEAVFKNENTLRTHEGSQMSSQKLEIQQNEDEKWLVVNRRQCDIANPVLEFIKQKRTYHSKLTNGLKQ